MNRGSVGFLMNDYDESDLLERLHAAELTAIRPLRMVATDESGKSHKGIAFNEVSLLRQRSQAAKLQISIDHKVRLEELICDGLLLSTPAGSTAYNLSAHGPILPVNSPLLALTPISAFRPRRWRGAVLPHDAKVTITVLEPDKRPVASVADHVEVRHVKTVEIAEDKKRSVKILFDPGHSLAERVSERTVQVLSGAHHVGAQALGDLAHPVFGKTANEFQILAAFGTLHIFIARHKRLD